MNAQNELETLIPQPVEVTVAGEKLEILPFKLGQLPAMIRACAPFMGLLKAGDVNWIDLIAQHGDNVLDALALATGKPRAWVEGLEIDQAIGLAQAVVEVNADFFIQRVTPAVTRAASAMAGKIGASGRMPASA